MALDDGERITVGELKRRLSIFPDDAEITFGSTRNGVPLVFYRTKGRGPDLVHIELKELHEDD